MGAVAAAVIIAAGLVTAFETKVFTPSHPTPTVVNLPLAAGPGRRWTRSI